MSTRTQRGGRIRTSNRVERQNNQSNAGNRQDYNQTHMWNGAGYEQQNNSKQNANTSDWRNRNDRGRQATNNRGGASPFWRTREGRNAYTENLGINGPFRNRSPQQDYFQVPTNGRGGERSVYNQRVRNYNDWQYSGGRDDRRDVERARSQQELRPSALQLSSQGRGKVWSNPVQTRPKRTTEDWLGMNDKPVDICTARNLLQEEYEIQAAEYAAKNREKEIKKLEEKMMRLRFCSAYDLGHRLSENTRELSAEERDRMVQKIQDEYNQQAKIYAQEVKVLGEKKAELQSAKQMEKYQQSPLYREMLRGDENRPKESTGAVPKQKAYDNFEKKKKYKADPVKTSQPTVSPVQRELMEAVNSLTRPSTMSNNQRILIDAINIPAKPVIASHNKKPPKEEMDFPTKLLEDVKLLEFAPSTCDKDLKAARKRMQDKLDKELALKKQEEFIANLSEFAPSTSDNSLKESRWKMQGNLDQQLALKKQDEEKMKAESNKNGKPNEQPLLQKKAGTSTDCFASQSHLCLGFNEIDTMPILNLSEATANMATTDNHVLVLRPLEVIEFKNGIETEKPGDTNKAVSKETKETADNRCEKVTNGNKIPPAVDLSKTFTKEIKEQEAANTNTRPLSIQEQLRMRAVRLDKDYEEHHAQHFMPSSKEQPNQETLAVKQVVAVKQIAKSVTVPPPLAVPSMIPLDLDQINEYDRTGIPPKTKRLFSTRGSDSFGQPVLKLRAN